MAFGQLGALTLGLGALGSGGGGSGAAADLVLSLAPSSDTGTLGDNITEDTTPDIVITPAVALVEGDVITLEYGTASNFSGATQIVDTIDNLEALSATITETISALAPGTWYFRAKKNSGAWSATLTLQIVDLTAPTLSSPTGTKTGQTTATLGVTTDEGNGTLYGVLTTSATPPSKAQVKAGQNNGGTAAAYSFNQAVSASGAQSKNATGLTSATTYYAYFMHEDSSTNQSNVAAASSFVTDSAATALDPSKKAAGITLSGSNLIASVAGNAFANVLSVAGHSSGKYYYEVTINALSADNQRFGFATASVSLTGALGTSDSEAVVWNIPSGHVVVNGGFPAAIQTAGVGDVLGIAFDIGNGKVWFRTNNGNWNNSGAANPATNAGGVSTAGLTAGTYYAVLGLEITGDNFTANFGGTAYANAAPSGFGNL